MNTQLSLSTQKTMSSLEIAKLTGKEHDNVRRDIKTVLEQAGIKPLSFEVLVKTESGQTAKVFNLPRLECDLVVSGYSVQYRMAIIKRWHELENQQQFAIPQTLSEALLLAGQLAAEKEAALAKIEADKPAVAFAKIVSDSSNTRCIRVWVKTMKHENNLTVGEKEVFKWLVDNKYIYRDGKSYLPYSRYESNGTGYFTVVLDEINGRPIRKLKITGKGVTNLTGKVVNSLSPLSIKNS